MTVGELKAKLAIYNDDTEIFIYEYDGMSCGDSYNHPYIYQDNVRTYTTKNGYVHYTSHYLQDGSKQHTVLVIG